MFRLYPQPARNVHSRTMLLLCALAVSLLLSACGGGNGSSNSSRAGHYTSSVALTGSQTGALDITVDAGGNATGTLTVNDPTRATHSRVVVVTVNLSGTVDANGAFHLTGSYSDGETTQTVEVTGNAANGAALALTYLGHVFNGTWTFTGIATPGGGGGTATFSSASGTNANTTDLSLPLVAGTITNIPGLGSLVAVTSTPLTNPNSRMVSFGIQGTVTAGQTYTINDDTVSVHYSESTGGLPNQWTATAGTIEIVNYSSSKITFHIRNATMHTLSGAATGTFTLNFDGETTAVVSGP